MLSFRFYGSFDGSMRQEKREAVVKGFVVPNKSAVAGSKDDRDNPMVMLLSLQVRRTVRSPRLSRTDQSVCTQAGALGLNLTVASQVFMMDP